MGKIGRKLSSKTRQEVRRYLALRELEQLAQEFARHIRNADLDYVHTRGLTPNLQDTWGRFVTFAGVNKDIL